MFLPNFSCTSFLLCPPLAFDGKQLHRIEKINSVHKKRYYSIKKHYNINKSRKIDKHPALQLREKIKGLGLGYYGIEEQRNIRDYE